MSRDIDTKLFINNEYVDAKSGNTFEIRNPADDRLVASDIQVAGPEDVDDAVAAATAAFNGPWRSLTGAQRSDLLHKFAALLNDHLDQVSSLETGSMGIPISVSQSCLPAWLFLTSTITPDTPTSWKGVLFPLMMAYTRLFRMSHWGYLPLLPHGKQPRCIWPMSNIKPVLYFLLTNSRYFGWKIAPALATGNTVIFKASEKSPLGALALGRLFVKAGFPPGVVNLVTGGGETGQLLASHQKTRKISFTGSVAVGRKAQEAATKSNLKRVTLELGGKSPAIIFDDAGLDKAVSAISQGFLLNSGQVCAAASRVYVHESVVSEFVAGLKANFEGANRTLGQSPLNPQTVLGPVADSIQFNRVLDFIKDGERTAQLVTGGLQKGTRGFFIEPTIFLDPSSDARIYREEIFGPVVVIKTFRTEDEVIALAKNTEYGLSACLYTENISRALRVASKIESETVAVNSAFLPSPSTAFGGFKQSGNGGRESGKYALHDYLQTKTIHIKQPRSHF